MSKARWLAERRDDPWVKRARREGYPSRAAYKLLFVQRGYGLIEEGDAVVDIGAAPGGMLKLESELVGPGGLVVAVDTRRIVYSADNVKHLCLDIKDPAAAERILEALGWRRCDVLVSDASPSFTGVREVDALVQLELSVRSLQLAGPLLRRGGNVLVKALECGELRQVERALKRSFAFYKRVVTPPSLRRHSSEVYLLGMGKKSDGVAVDLEGAS